MLYGKTPVLDPMMGSGTTLIEAAKLGLDAYGIDIEEKFVELAKSKFPIRTLRKTIDLRENIQQGDVRKLPFKDRSIGFIVTSPPYWNAISIYRSRSLSSVFSQYEDSPLIKRRLSYSHNPVNLGNIQKYAVYLSEMEKAYLECYRVLKEQSYMVIIVKDIRREHKTVPISVDTVKICQKVGFDIFDMIINKMYFPSFWIVHQVTKANEKGFPQTLRTHEHILVFQKPEVA